MQYAYLMKASLQRCNTTERIKISRYVPSRSMAGICNKALTRRYSEVISPHYTIYQDVKRLALINYFTKKLYEHTPSRSFKLIILLPSTYNNLLSRRFSDFKHSALFYQITVNLFPYSTIYATTLGIVFNFNNILFERCLLFYSQLTFNYV